MCQHSNTQALWFDKGTLCAYIAAIAMLECSGRAVRRRVGGHPLMMRVDAIGQW